MFSASHFHPMLVHFPIALVSFGFLAFILSFIFKKQTYLSYTSFFLLVFGTLMAILAVATGFLFTSEMEGAAGEVREAHESAALVTLGFLIITSLLSVYLKMKKKEDSNLKWLVFVFYSLAALSVSYTGFLGGNLVYNFMMPL